jgi:hypothetical protein
MTIIGEESVLNDKYCGAMYQMRGEEAKPACSELAGKPRIDFMNISVDPNVPVECGIIAPSIHD